MADYFKKHKDNYDTILNRLMDLWEVKHDKII